MTTPDLPEALLEQLAAAAESAGLRDRLDLLQAHASACYLLVGAAEQPGSLGGSRIGGEPDLPSVLAWPTSSEGECLNFLAQLNLEEFAGLASLRSRLPERGMLWLFAEVIDAAAVPAAVRVVYEANPRELERRQAPPADRLCHPEYLVDIKPVAVSAVPAVSLPFYDERLERALYEPDCERNPWPLIELESALKIAGTEGQVLGHANAHDEDLYRQIALTRMGERDRIYQDYWQSIDEYEATIAKWERKRRWRIFRTWEWEAAARYRRMRPGVEWLLEHARQISAEAERWQLLLRIDSSTRTEICINDFDPLYVFASDNDIRSGWFLDVAAEVTQG